MIELILIPSVSMQMIAKSVSVKLRALGSTPALLPLIRLPNINGGFNTRVFSSCENGIVNYLQQSVPIEV